MDLQATKAVHEVSNTRDANNYLKLGWVLVAITQHGGHDSVGQFFTSRYVLAWQGDGELRRPLREQGAGYREGPEYVDMEKLEPQS